MKSTERLHPEMRDKPTVVTRNQSIVFTNTHSHGFGTNHPYTKHGCTAIELQRFNKLLINLRMFGIITFMLKLVRNITNIINSKNAHIRTFARQNRLLYPLATTIFLLHRDKLFTMERRNKPLGTWLTFKELPQERQKPQLDTRLSKS